MPALIAAAALGEFALPGLSISIAGPDGSVATASAGLAERSSKKPVTETTRFRIGSVSKALTSAALGVLLDDGTLTLDDPVVRYVPEFADHPARGASIRQLAAHMSGIPHYKGRDFLNRRHYESLAEALGIFKDRPSVFTPGKGFAYSSFGWNLLGLALERASGVTFLDLMRQRVFQPLRLADTAPDMAAQGENARPYLRLGRMTVPAPRVDPSDSWPSAGFVATTQDLVRYGLAIQQGRLLAHQTTSLLWEETQTGSGVSTGYGLGWQWIPLAGHRVVGHGGAHVGATACLWILPEAGTAVALATNTNAPPGALTRLAGDVLAEELAGGG